MLLPEVTDALHRVVSSISRWFNSVGAGILLAMMFLTAVDVIMRYFFNRPILGSYEITAYMMAVFVPFGLAYCAFSKGHVYVELLVSRFSPKIEAIISSITYLVSFGIFLLITWRAALYVKVTFYSGTTSAVLHIPIFPFVATVALGCGLLCAALFALFLDSLSHALEKK
jgi:TRAP-type C4-dicarboxylate transport system permease small subunit